MNTASWINELSDGALSILVDTRIYSLEVLFRTCYVFTDRCYLFLEPWNDREIINICFSKKNDDCALAEIAAEFCNELVNQHVRLKITSETRPIRELIVAQAFAEADLIDRSGTEGSYIDDPRGINTTK